MAFITSTCITSRQCKTLSLSSLRCVKKENYVYLLKRSLSFSTGIKGKGKVLLTMETSSTKKCKDEESLEIAWPKFAERMRESNQVASQSEWHNLLAGLLRAKDDAKSAIWVLNLMRETGITPTASTYELALSICNVHDDRVAAFHLVEHMFEDKVLLGDVELPDGMEVTLRKILPPEAFE